MAGRCALDSIAPARLGAVQSGIRAPYGLRDALPHSILGDPNGDGYGESGTYFIRGTGFQSTPKPIGALSSSRQWRLRQRQQKFISAVAADVIDVPQLALHRQHDHLELQIPGLMAQHIVHALEIVQIQ
jgi:hypothetical protein